MADEEGSGTADGGWGSAKKTFVLCFDGTGNNFTGTETDSNIIKIYRLLDRALPNQYHYYQPGIGTYGTSTSLDHTGSVAKVKSWYTKKKDMAIGTNLALHVMGGYKFLMRYYSPEDDIYIFGFSRGAYTARFLAEMLDHIGLLSAGNEELQRFAWKCFSKWQARRGGDSPADKKKELEMHEFLKNFRETFSRPVRRIRFLGLFDTVNSVPRFENAWMQRTKFPYTARTRAKVIRHAVSINERRAKFRQDLITNENEKQEEMQPYRLPGSNPPATMEATTAASQSRKLQPSVNIPSTAQLQNEVGQQASQHADQRHVPRRYSDAERSRDVLEVWFPGNHSDIGGGWGKGKGETWMLSHGPLVWMVHEAEKAGLKFDKWKMAALNCCPDLIDDYGNRTENGQIERFSEGLHKASTEGLNHDCLEFGAGLPGGSVLTWKIMEYLPFRRMDLKPDGGWKAIRWPLPQGETRDVPADAKIHRSAIVRMQTDERYRPGNLVFIGKGGRGVKTAPKHAGIGEWEVILNEGNPVSEVYMKKGENYASQSNGRAEEAD